MADNNTIRSYRSNDPHRRGGASSSAQPAAAGDPLAELARLIGQSDPFADVGQGSPRRAEPPRATPRPAPPASHSDWRQAAAATRPYEPEEPSPRYERPTHQGSARHHAYADDQRDDRYDERYDDDRFGDRFADDRQYQDDQHAQAHRTDAYEDDSYEDHHDEVRYAADLDDAHGAAYYDEGAPMGPHDEELYDDPPRSRGRNGLITAVTLVACAMIGTAGAYGYRTYYSGSGVGRTPPVITAETTPSKVVSAADQPPTKSFQDRLGEPGQNERVVSHEEQPIEFKTQGTPSPQLVLPAPAGSPQQGADPGRSGRGGGQQATASIPGGSSSTGSSEPKRVHTVTIRPEGTEVGGGLAGQSAAVPTPARTDNAKPAQGGRAPISLDPQAAPKAAPPAAAAPAPRAPQLASAPANVPSGGYVVQLSSQKSEAEAQASFRSLQVKFPDQLGSRSPIIRRADLGDKGVYYRAMIGPFGNADEASRFCSSYKAAGGQCIIQRN